MKVSDVVEPRTLLSGVTTVFLRGGGQCTENHELQQ